jgi:HD-GYP domain-containing protein (c-di-GMP phosphodiesterase class II)
MPLEHACREVTANAGSQFDPHVARALVEVVAQMDGDEELEGKFVRYAS